MHDDLTLKQVCIGLRLSNTCASTHIKAFLMSTSGAEDIPGYVVVYILTPGRRPLCER